MKLWPWGRHLERTWTMALFHAHRSDGIRRLLILLSPSESCVILTNRRAGSEKKKKQARGEKRKASPRCLPRHARVAPWKCTAQSVFICRGELKLPYISRGGEREGAREAGGWHWIPSTYQSCAAALHAHIKTLNCTLAAPGWRPGHRCLFFSCVRSCVWFFFFVILEMGCVPDW